MPSFPGLTTLVNGMNSKGIVLTQRATPMETGGRKGKPIGIIMRELLENANNFAEAKEFIYETEINTPRSVLIASSRENKSSIFEIMPDENIVEIKTKSFSVAANHFKSINLNNIQTKPLKNKDIKDFFKMAYRNSFRRERFLDSSFQNADILNIDSFIKIFSDFDNTLEGLNPTVSHFETIQAIIFSLDDNKIYLANGNKPPVTKGDYIEIQL